MPEEDPHTWRAQWALRPDVVYLNHGSFGPSPRAILEAQQNWIARLESEPVDFLVRQWHGHVAETCRRLGEFLGSPGHNLVPADNSTAAMNIVAASFPLRPDDEVLLNDHEYGAVQRIWERACRKAGARLIVQRLPTPVTSRSALVDTLMAAVTARTRLIVFSHITSPTALVLPAAEICQAAQARGIATCVDGPHALAVLPVDLSALDCDYYTASCHKWLCAPFGSGFLYVHPRRQADVEPIAMSWGRSPPGDEPSWRDEFTWAGTRDLSAFFSVPAAIEFLAAAGLDAFRSRTHELAQYARKRITKLTGREPLSPDSRDWYGSMVALPLPAGDAEELHKGLWNDERIEVPVYDWQGQRLIRVSCHLYNSVDDIDRLVAALARRL